MAKKLMIMKTNLNLATIIFSALLLSGCGGSTPQSSDDPIPYSEASFLEWLKRKPERIEQFEEFEEFLRAKDVQTVVPAWQLTRTDSTIKRSCRSSEFLIPPKGKWNNLVPVLRFVRKEVMPIVGPLEAVSAYRTESLNNCVGGARGSRHLTFSGADFITVKKIPNSRLFSKLCELHRKVGRKHAMGLGAYFDPKNDNKNAIGRFHIDLTGYRTWGFSYRGASSACRQI